MVNVLFNSLYKWQAYIFSKTNSKLKVERVNKIHFTRWWWCLYKYISSFELFYCVMLSFITPYEFNSLLTTDWHGHMEKWHPDRRKEQATTTTTSTNAYSICYLFLRCIVHWILRQHILLCSDFLIFPSSLKLPKGPCSRQTILDTLLHYSLLIKCT